MDDHAPFVPKALRGRQAKRRPSWQTVLIAFLIPPLAFITIYNVTSFKIHHRFLITCWAIVVAMILLGLLSMGVAYGRWRRGRPGAAAYVVVALGYTIAVVTGTFMGDRNYWKYMKPYYSYQDLAIYVNIDPAIEHGQTFMDAGEVYFKEGAYVARENAIAFRNRDIYCAAPIIKAPLETQGGAEDVKQKGVFQVPDSGTVDFWAVGTNCCMPSGERFECGGATNPMARSGLREVRDDQRPFYRLAVEEWAAEYGLPVRHPIFFYWMQDPMTEVEGYVFVGHNNYFKSCFLHFLGNGVISFAVLWVVAKYGV